MIDLVAAFTLVMGVAMTVIWTLDIRARRGFDATSGLLRAREASTGSLIIWHWLAEYGTAGTLVVAALLLFADAAMAMPIAFVGLGALAYSACNSLAWALARTERRPYALPMSVGLVGSLISIVALFGAS